MPVILHRERDSRTLDYDEISVRHLPGTETAVLHVHLATTKLTRADWARLAIVAGAWAQAGTAVRRCEECQENVPHDGHACLVCGTECCLEDDSPCPYHAELLQSAADERALDYAEETAREDMR